MTLFNHQHKCRMLDFEAQIADCNKSILQAKQKLMALEHEQFLATYSFTRLASSLQVFSHLKYFPET
jgi:hypothetical protein